MTVHAVEVVCSTKQASNPDAVPSPEPPDLVNALPDRISQNVFDTLTEVLPGQASDPRILNTKTDGSGTDHIRFRKRVDSQHSKSEVLDRFENGAFIDAEWYEIRHHDCDHDQPDGERTGCPDWKTERSKGSPPSGV